MDTVGTNFSHHLSDTEMATNNWLKDVKSSTFTSTISASMYNQNQEKLNKMPVR